MSAQLSNCRTDAVLRRDLFAAAGRERTDTAEFLALIAEFDARRLYVPEGYSSMHAFCVGELLLCEESAYKRIQAARAARRFPQLLPALADGRLHLSAVFVLAPHLTPGNADELVAAATHKTIRAIRDLITLRVIAPEPAFDWAATAEPSETVAHSGQLETFPVDEQAVVAPRVERPRRIDVHCTVDREKLDQARALLSHCVPSGELGAVIDRALDAVIREVERRKFGATPRPRRVEGTRPTAKARHIPAGVKREVWVRDGARCTFVGRAGHRCGERRFLEFDHVRPAALGGEATTENLRLRCRVHNQHEAERVYGAEFMTEKREVARRGRFEARKTREATRESQADRVRQIASGLRNLGCRADEARSAAEAAVETAPPDAPIEEVLRTALRSLAPPRSTRRDERAPEPLERTEAVAV